jgi:ribosomal protein S18 acetylase RimI-like enzyme
MSPRQLPQIRSAFFHLRIIRSEPDDAATLTDIAFAAKRHWGYPEKWIKHWRAMLTIQPQFVVSCETYAAKVGDRLVGFYALVPEGSQMDLMHLWVQPEFMGRGIGRALLMHGMVRAKNLGFKEMEIKSDPNAEGFYRPMGARRVGTNSGILYGVQRDLPVMILRF